MAIGHQERHAEFLVIGGTAAAAWGQAGAPGGGRRRGNGLSSGSGKFTGSLRVLQAFRARRLEAFGMGFATTTDQLADLLSAIGEATDAYIGGDIERYFELFDHGDDYVLMPPYGGPSRHGHSLTAERLAALQKFFAGGSGVFELDGCWYDGDLAVVAGIERQRGEVGGLPEQDWSLRVTLVLRRRGERWEMVHRHADGLVREISFDAFSRLARGDLQRE